MCLNIFPLNLLLELWTISFENRINLIFMWTIWKPVLVTFGDQKLVVQKNVLWKISLSAMITGFNKKIFPQITNLTRRMSLKAYWFNNHINNETIMTENSITNSGYNFYVFPSKHLWKTAANCKGLAKWSY